MSPAAFSILIVDDDPDSIEPLAWFLRSRGYRVFSALHGREALMMMRGGWVRPSVILLDLNMPVMDGWQFLEARDREPARLATIPVLLITGAPLDIHPQHPTLRAVLTKPVTVEQIVGELEAIRNEIAGEQDSEKRG